MPVDETMVVEGFSKTVTLLIVEYTELLLNSEDDDSFTSVVDGKSIDNTPLLLLMEKKDDVGVVGREEIKVSDDKTPVTLENDTPLLRLEGDEDIAFAEEKGKTAEGES